MPIQQNYTDEFLLHRENIMMCISFILYDNNKNIELNGINFASGAISPIKIKKNMINSTIQNFNINLNNLNPGENLQDLKIFKYESLRFSKNQIKIPTPSFQKMYPINNYASSQILFSYMIQKYLFSLNNSFIPNIHNLIFDFDKNKNINSHNIEMFGEIKMNLAINNSKGKKSHKYSQTFFKIIFDNSLNLYTKNNYIKFIIKIFIKLCDVLIYFQNKCFFVHRDLHSKNIIINYNLLEDNNIDIENFEIKLIDFSYSSIVINNQNNILSQLTYNNLNPFFNSTITNPFINKNWENVDFHWFFILLLIANRYYDFKINEVSDLNQKNKIEQIFNILINILNIDYNYFNKFTEYANNINIKHCIPGFKIMDLFYKKNILIKIFSINLINSKKKLFDFDKFNPRILKNIFLQELSKY
jgi:hypothetical protein